jgi:type VI secretion system protein ImpH
MAAPIGTENPDVTALAKVREHLFDEPWPFDFFQAVRLLERLQPHREAVGRYANPRNEIVRFGGHPTLNFPASAIQALTERPDACPAMDINFFGLVGPLGVLPNHITELVAARVRARDHTLLEFFNLFNHRLTSFFYQAWEKHHFTVAYERDRNDPLTKILFALIGFGTAGLLGRQPVDDESFIHYAGLFGLIPRSALALESIVGDYFGVPAEVEPFIGVWRGLEERDQCVFDGEILESTMLGGGAVVGDEIWDAQSRVRLKIGPLSAARYEEFLPEGSAWPKLKAIARSFCGNDLEFEIQLILKKADVPALELCNPAEGGLRLGWHTWLKSTPHFNRDPGDTILLLGEA